MQRFYSDRDTYGPEFDDRLIRLVRDNPAIYEVNHPHYRRNPVRVAIWERIATELAAPSKFLQTKWKNIRYNYLQEVKCLETGQMNVNVRRRRFTEDLSFLLTTAQTYNVKKNKSAIYNSSDNDSNSYMFPDAKATTTPHAYEVIEIEHSDDDSLPSYEDAARDELEMDNDCNDDDETCPELAFKTDNQVELVPIKTLVVESANGKELTLKRKYLDDDETQAIKIQTEDLKEPLSSGKRSNASSPSSPLLTPLVALDNGENIKQPQKSSTPPQTNGDAEVTIEPISKAQMLAQRASGRVPPSEIMANAAKRKAMPAPVPMLTPINDPIELYCLSLVDSLRNMPRSERERVKFEFAKILKDAKYKDQS